MTFTPPMRIITKMVRQRMISPRKETSNDFARCPLESLMKELQWQRSQKLDFVRLMEQYVEFGGKQMRQSTITNLICKNVEKKVVLSEQGNRSVVFFHDSNIVTLNIIKDDYADDNLEAALDVVTTHQKGMFCDGVQELDLLKKNLQRYCRRICNGYHSRNY